MKKVFLFLSIIMFAFTGVLFACNEDRYADLKISVASVTYGEANTQAARKTDGKYTYYEVLYGETFTITANTTCSSDISHAVLFDSLSDTSVNYISKQDTANGSKAVFKAAAPSYENYFKINLRSVETSKNSTSVYIKVLLPVASVSLQENLLLTSGINLNLKEYTTFTSKPQSTFETNEKDVTYTLTKFTPASPAGAESVSLVKDDPSSTIYKLYGSTTDAFKLENGVVEVLDKSLEGSIDVEVTSFKFNAAIEEEAKALEAERLDLTEEQIANRNLKDQKSVSVVKGIALENISFVGGQIGFDYGSESPNSKNPKSKLNASLYINSSDTYTTTDGKTHRFHVEQIDLTVATKSNIAIKAEVGSIIDDEGNTILSDSNVITIENGDNLPLTGSGSEKNATVNLVTAGASGNAYVDFIISFSGFSNLVEYRFSDLYADYLAELEKVNNDADSDNDVNISSLDTQNTKLNIYASALPNDIVVMQDGEKVNVGANAQIKIYDAYNQSDNISSCGTKISTQLALASGLISSKIDDENKKIRVFVSNDDNVNVSEYIEIRDSRFNRISLVKHKNTDVYYFDLNLVNESTSYFYAKAIKDKLAQNAVFNFELENILASSIKDFANGTSHSPSNKKVSFKAETVKGVEEIVALVSNGGVFYEVDSKNLTPEPLYQQVVLQANGDDFSEATGTILGIIVNAGVDAEEVLNVYVKDNKFAEIKEDYVSGSNTLFADYDKYTNGSDVVLQYNKGISIVGKKVGTTTLYIESENGYFAVVTIKVVSKVDAASFGIDIKQNHGSEIVTENNLNDQQNTPSISAKVGGNFNIVYSVNPDTSGVVDVEYLVYKKGTYGSTNEPSTILTINQDTGVVKSTTTGQATIVVRLTYYDFNLVGDYYGWSAKNDKEIVFDATIYEPATSIRLTRYNFEEGEVYDRNSLGYEFKNKSLVSVGVIITPSSATIANDSAAITYKVKQDKQNLVGSNGEYTAYLFEGQTKAIVYITVTVEEFGYKVDLTCKVVITRAPQIESIDYTVFEGDVQTPKGQVAGTNYDYISAKNGKTLKFNTLIKPSSKDVYVDDLVVTIFKDDGHEKLSTAMFSGNAGDEFKAQLIYGVGAGAQSITLSSGTDTFQLKIDGTQSGTFFVVIFARDSMTSNVAGKVVKIIRVDIENGTVESPFVVDTLNELLEINDNPAAHYVLGANINIGSIANWTALSTLTGSLNGYNKIAGKFYTISGLKIDKINAENVGLFEAIGKNDGNHSIGAVLNLKLVVSYISVDSPEVAGDITSINLGAIAGTNSGVIFNCSVEAPVYEVSLGKTANIGGVVGFNEGGIFNFPIAYEAIDDVVDLSTLKYSSDGIISENLITQYATTIKKIESLAVGETYFDVLEQFCVSTNPVNVNMVVSDTNAEKVYVGGIAGSQQGGYINGIYGIYSDIEERLANNVNYITTYQSQGVDVVANINTNAGSIENAGSKIGGVVGDSYDGYVSNVSASGQIGRYDSQNNTVSGANNYVGGVVGQASANAFNQNKQLVSNVTANVKLRANSYVGGIAGFIEKANIKLARTEAYQSNLNDVDGQTLIIANNKVGGVAGAINSAIITYSYSYSYIDDLNATYRQMGDIYLTGNEDNAVAGGLVGHIGGLDIHNDGASIVQQSYSTFNIITPSSTATIAGVVGALSDHAASVKLSNIFYVGVLQVAAGATKYALAPSLLDSGAYNYYYLLQYTQLDDGSYVLTSDPNDCFAGDATKRDPNIYNTVAYYSFKYSVVDENGVVANVVSEQNNVLIYESLSGNGNLDFIRYIPDSITVGTNPTNVHQITDNTLTFDNYSASKKYFYSYTDGNGVLHIVALYSAINNEFNLNDLFSIVPMPSVVGRLNILVNSNNTKVVSITNLGELIINGLGRAELTFSVRENSSSLASQTIVVDIVENFDKLLVSNSLSFNNDLLASRETVSVRKDTAVNLFGLLGEYVQDPSSNVVHETDGLLSLIEIANTTGYTLEYLVYSDSGYNTLADASLYTISNKSISFNTSGTYYIKLVVSFTLDGTTYSFTNTSWNVTIQVIEGASHIKFDAEQIWVAGNETKTVDIILTSDAAELDVTKLVIYLNSEANKFVYVEDRNEIEYTGGTPAVINLTYVDNSYRCVGTSHFFTFNINIAENYRYQTTTSEYTLYAYDAGNILIANPAQLKITVAPQGVAGVAGIHYAYTQSVSEVEGNVNTEATTENTNYAYSFTNEPKDTVVAGGEGLFVIDLYPYYSNITSVSVHSSMGDSGNALQFVQLVKIKNMGDGYSYVYGPQTQASSEGGLLLNLYSYVDPDDARLKYENNVYTIETALASLKDSYRFDDKSTGNSDKSEIGRLYLKTVAPTNLKEEESFIVYVTVTYKALTAEHEFVEMQKVYEHKLVVESMPGFDLSISHNGTERNVIAYTGLEQADHLDIIPTVGDGYSYKSIAVELFKTSDDPNKEIIRGKGRNDLTHIILEDITGGKRLLLGSQALVGDTILVSVELQISLGGYIQTRFYTEQVKVVDVTIESVSIEGLDGDRNLKLTVSTSKQLRVKINGFGTSSALTQAENQISRSISSDNSINYWYAKSSNVNEYYVNLDSVNVRNNLPFLINKVALSNEITTVKVDGTAVGASTGQAEVEISTLSKLIVLEGSTSSGSAEMLLRFSYVYLDSNINDNVKKGQIVFVPNEFSTSFVQEKYFTVVVTEDSNEDNPTPIYTEADLKKMASTTGGDYILMNDITITNHTALNAEFASFDGNNKIITIESFAYNANLVSSNSSYSINMGLFDTVSSNTIVKNVIVALPADKREAMDLTGYATINFGGIAAINNGVITNCDVISVTNTDKGITLDSYLNSMLPEALSVDFINSYTLHIETSDIINGNDVAANIGLLVGQNGSTGFVTNSRVGRESVEVLSVHDSESTVVYKNTYEYTAPVMLVKIYGRANVGGFVALNEGTISSSYSKNIQLEVISKSTTGFVKTGGFVVANAGYIHGSYVAGWEEDDLGSSDGYTTSANRKLGGGIYSNGFIGGFVYLNQGFIEDAYSNVNISGSLTFAAQTDYIKFLKKNENANDWVSPAVGGFVYTSESGSVITTSYSLSKITTKDTSSRSNTHGAFEGRIEAPDPDFDNSGDVSNSYFMQEKDEVFSYEHERAIKLTDDPAIDLGDSQTVSGQNEFILPGSFNNFSFDNSISDFSKYTGESMGGVWAIYKPDGTHGYPELISANTVAISSRVINVTKTKASDTNRYYYTYVDGYEIGSTKNPYLVSTFEQFNNIFKDTVNANTTNFNQNVSTKFTGNIRLVKHINFANSEEVYSTSVEYTSLVDLTSIFDGNYLAMYNITLVDNSSGKTSFGLFKDIYYAAVKNVTLAIDKVGAGNTTTVGALAGAIVNSNISNVTLVASTDSTGIITGNNYVGGLAGIIVSNDEENLFTISNIKSNLSVVGGVSTSTTVSAITTSKVVWERIKPTATSSGLSELNANLRLHRLPVTVYYAGGVAGILDLHQVDDGTGKLEVTTVNAYNIHVGEFTTNTNLGSSIASYNTNVSIISDYSGGLFGMIGEKTYLETSELIVNSENEKHFISAKEIAGGIAAVNFGKISQSYVSFNEQNTSMLNTSIVEYLKQEDLTANTHLNTTLFASGTPKYIGGIAGINVGNGDYGSGHIIDCYNRVDVRNTNAIGVGGIVGGSYIGQISNVYTTASLLGNLQNDKTKIGAIIGKIFGSDEDFDEGYFADFQDDNSGATDNLILLNIVALNLWIEDDFDALYDFAKINSIGALYGQFENAAAAGDETDTFVKIDANSGVYVQNYALKNFNDSDISKETFNIETDLDPETYFELWGTSENENSSNYNAFLAQYFTAGESNENLITPNDYRALFSGTEYGVSSLRDTYFSSIKWSRAIWNYDNDKLLPVLEYGYETSVIRIYTANQFINELSSGTTSGKFYVIMNDIDFNNIDIKPITQTFRGHLYGNNVTYSNGTNEYTRKPILFNLAINATGEEDEELNAKYAMFTDSHGAVFENFNIVLKSYNVSFYKTGDEKIASVLVANSVDTTMNNVHIYSSLTSFVNEEIVEGNYKFADDEPYVTKGTYYDVDLNSLQFSDAFLKVATLDNQIGKTAQEVESFAPAELYYTLNNADPDDPKFVASSYKDAAGTTHSGAALDTLFANLEAAGKTPTREVDADAHAGVTVTNANHIGLLSGSSSLSYITHSSVNIVNMTTAYNNMQSDTLSVSIGALVGVNTGEVRNIAGSVKITVEFVPDADPNDEIKGYNGFKEAHIGSLVGSHSGVVNHAYAKSAEITVGSDSTPIKAASGNEGTFIGGAFGATDRYTTQNDAVVGGTEYLYLTNCKVKAYVSGVAKIGGAIGQNSFTASDIYNTQTVNGVGVEVVVFDATANYLIGGIIGYNNASIIANTFTNASIDVKVKIEDFTIGGTYTLKVGGIIAYSNVEVELKNTVNDADFINIDNGTNPKNDTYVEGLYKTGTLYVGGIAAHIEGASSILHLYNVLTCADIKATQENVLYAGGAVGKADGGLVISSGAVLGDIYLWRANKAPDKTLFFKGVQRIGGLVGELNDDKNIDRDANINNADECKFVVFSTIRDYAIAQKTELKIGPVIGNSLKNDQVRDVKIAYCEAIALVSNNGYEMDKFVNIAQTDDVNGNANLWAATVDAYEAVLREYDGTSQFDVHNDSDIYSKCDTYFNVFDEAAAYEAEAGTKLKPITFGGSLASGQYYVLDANIDSTITTTETNWVLNAQGFMTGVYPAIGTITEGSAVVGLLANCNGGANPGIASTNYGFIFSCGVAGQIEGSAVSSIVENNYGVISTSFSIADLYGRTASGLAGVNGIAGEIGNIYSSYYTGSIMPTATGSYFAGLTYNNEYGVISNSYTMADIDTTNYSVSDKAYPVTGLGGNNTYRTFYDYVAYTGDKEGEAAAADPSKITSTGLYVWSSTLTGDSKDYLKGGNWLTPSDRNDIAELKALYKTSSNYINDNSEPDNDDLNKLDVSWFNYGYATNNLVNILVGADNISNYFNMLYTGNGLASREDAGDPDKQNWSYSLLDQPYKVKHAGILDVLVAGNNKETEISYKYYLFTKNINFIKYTGQTYWSQGWDDPQVGVVFVGDLDGYKADDENYKVVNMFSSYGLVRAMQQETGAEARATTVRNINIESSYSKTGLVAGYMEGEKTIIQNIDVLNSIVYNGNISPLEKGIFADGGYDDEDNDDKNKNFAWRNFNIMPTKAGSLANVDNGENFAGGLVGYMNGGTIDSTCSLGGTYVLASDKDYDLENEVFKSSCVNTYIGGMVGYMIGGTIGSGEETADHWVFDQELTVASVSASVNVQSYVGGIAGYVSMGTHAATIQKIKLTNVNIFGSYAVGGIAGKLGLNGQLINNTYENGNVGAIAVQNTSITDGIDNVKMAPSELRGVTSIHVGGIVGVAESGTIQTCAVSTSITISVDDPGINAHVKENSEISLGGIAGLLNGATIKACTNSGNISQETSAFSQRIVGGIAGLMNAGLITKDDDDNNTISTGKIGSDNNNISGGIVGKMTNGSVEYSSNQGGEVSGSMSGGVVGLVDITTETNGEKATIQNCTSEAGATINGTYYAGGIVGKIYTTADLNPTQKTSHGFNCTIADCTNASKVATTNEEVAVAVNGADSVDTTTIYGIAGGIVGYATGKISNNYYSISIVDCQNTGSVATSNPTSNLSMAGGIAGFVSCVTIYGRDAATPAVSNEGEVSNAYISGGIVAYCLQTEISNVMSNSTVSADSLAGGIVALFEKNSKISKTIITGVNSEVNATGSGGVAGGIIGYTEKLSEYQVTIDRSAQITSGGKVKGFVAGGIFGYLNYATNESGGLSNAATVIATGERDGRTPLNKMYVFKDLDEVTGGNAVLTIDAINDTAHLEGLPDEATAGGVIGVVNRPLTLANTVINTGNVSAGDGSQTSAKGVAGGVVGQVTNNGSLTILSAQNSGTIGYWADESNGEYYNAQIAGGIIGVVSNSVIIGENPSQAQVDPDAEPTVISVLNVGAVTAATFAGGIAGDLNNGTIIGNAQYKIQNAGDITSTYDGASVTGGAAGGIVGRLYGTNPHIDHVANIFAKIEDNEYIPSVSAEKAHAGGIVGYMVTGTIGPKELIYNTDKTFENLENNQIEGEIEGKNAGGVVGYMAGGTLAYNKWNLPTSDGRAQAPTIKIMGVNAGGLVGYQANTSATIYGDASAITSGETANEYGIIGAADPDGVSTYVGGVVGRMAGGTISDLKMTVPKYDADGNQVEIEGILQTEEKTLNTIGGEVFTSIEGNSISGGGLVGYMVNGTIAGGTGGAKVKVLEAGSNPSYSGGLVGYMTGTAKITGGTFDGVVSAGNSVGGVVGFMTSGTIGEIGKTTGPSASGVTISAGKYRGGLVGYMATGSTIYYGTGASVSSGAESAGGIVGYMNGGSITGGSGGSVSGGKNAGGIVGEITGGSVGTSGEKNQVHSGAVSGGTNAGGVAGKMTGNKTTITGKVGGSSVEGDDSDECNVGGVVGLMEGGIISNGKSGSVKGNEDSHVGSVVGTIKGGTITRGGGGNVLSGKNVGGIAGRAQGGTIACNPVASVEGKNAGGVVGEVDGKVTIATNSIECPSITAVDDADTKASAAGAIIGVTTSGEVGFTNDITIKTLPANIKTEADGTKLNNNDKDKTPNGTVVAKNHGAYLVPTNTITIAGAKSSGSIITITLPESSSMSLVNTNETSGQIANITVAVPDAGEILTGTNWVSCLTNGTAAGVIADYNKGNIYNCINTVNLEFIDVHFLGGIVGYNNNGNISSCTNQGAISSGSENMGGIVGYSAGTNAVVASCTNEKDIINSGGAKHMGGISGYCDAGKVNGTNKGKIAADDDGTTVVTSRTSGTNNFFTGSAYKTTPTVYAGGISGAVKNSISSDSPAVVEGRNTGDIQNVVNYTSSASSASVIDFRGQIVGTRADGDGPIVRNLAGHSPLNGAPQTKKYVPSNDKFIVVSYGQTSDYFTVGIYERDLAWGNVHGLAWKGDELPGGGGWSNYSNEADLLFNPGVNHDKTTSLNSSNLRKWFFGVKDGGRFGGRDGWSYKSWDGNEYTDAAGARWVYYREGYRDYYTSQTRYAADLNSMGYPVSDRCDPYTESAYWDKACNTYSTYYGNEFFRNEYYDSDLTCSIISLEHDGENKDDTYFSDLYNDSLGILQGSSCYNTNKYDYDVERFYGYHEFGSDDYILLVIYRAKYFDVNNATEGAYALQDCGGSFSGASADLSSHQIDGVDMSAAYASKETYEIIALDKLYKNCGKKCYEANLDTDGSGTVSEEESKEAASVSPTTVGLESEHSYNGGVGGAGEDAGLMNFSNLVYNTVDLVKWARQASVEEWGYCWGTHGEILTEDMMKDHTAERAGSEIYIGRRVSDCTGLIAGYQMQVARNQDDQNSRNWIQSWCWVVGPQKNDTSICHDFGTEVSYAWLNGVDWVDGKFPDIPGICLYRNNAHVGVYVGGGVAIHASEVGGGKNGCGMKETPYNESGGWNGWYIPPLMDVVSEDGRLLLKAEDNISICSDTRSHDSELLNADGTHKYAHTRSY